MSVIKRVEVKAHNNIYRGGLGQNYAARKVAVEIGIPQNGVNADTGMLVLVPGYGAGMESNIYRKMRSEFCDLYNLIVIQSEYFGSKYMNRDLPDIIKQIMTNDSVKQATIEYHDKINESLDEFNDMGMMQALDVVSTTLSVLYIADDEQLVINKKKIIMFGNSHGAYIGYLANVICPGLFAGFIDISTYLLPHYMKENRHIVTKTAHMEAWVVLEYLLKKNPQYRYSDILYDLRFLYKNVENKCKIIAFQGTEDGMVDYREKEEFIKQIGQNAQLLLVSGEDVDSILCKNADHGLGMDFIELFKMVMPMFDGLLREKASAIHLEKNVRIGDEKDYVLINYERGLPELLHITAGSKQ